MENKPERPLERQTHNISGMTVNPGKGIVHILLWEAKYENRLQYTKGNCPYSVL